MTHLHRYARLGWIRDHDFTSVGESGLSKDLFEFFQGLVGCLLIDKYNEVSRGDDEVSNDIRCASADRVKERWGGKCYGAVVDI